jgi:DNA-directed RNA polymerase subunit K/omega
MKAELVEAASLAVPNTQILVNVLRRRVRQLGMGHRPLVEHPVGMGLADIALTEISAGKITFESTLGEGKGGTVVQFPGVVVDVQKEGKAA